MSRINPYRSVYVPPQQPAAPTGRPGAAPPEATPPAAPARTSQANALSGPEQQMIDQLFPPKDTLALRLYGPSKGQQTLHPKALGGRLDLRG